MEDEKHEDNEDNKHEDNEDNKIDLPKMSKKSMSTRSRRTNSTALTKMSSMISLRKQKRRTNSMVLGDIKPRLRSSSSSLSLSQLKQTYLFQNAHESITIAKNGMSAISNGCVGTNIIGGRYNAYGKKINTKTKCKYVWTFRIRVCISTMIIGITIDNNVDNDHTKLDYGYSSDAEKYKLGVAENFGRKYSSGSEIQMIVDCVNQTISFCVQGKDKEPKIAYSNIDMSVTQYYPAVNMQTKYKDERVDLIDFYVDMEKEKKRKKKKKLKEINDEDSDGYLKKEDSLKEEIE
eukprot:479482_1